MIRISQLRLRPEQRAQREEALRRKAAGELHIPVSAIRRLELVRESIDARRKPDIFYTYTVDVETAGEQRVLAKARSGRVSAAVREVYAFPFPAAGGAAVRSEEDRPVIVGSGPAGLFCAYQLAQNGFRPILLERGAPVRERMREVERFWAGGSLHPESNVQFGEGGAGTFSDGKLNTLVKDPGGRGREVLRIFTEHGAPAQILFDSRPHIGTDILCRVVERMREAILGWGGEVRFHTKLTGLVIQEGQLAGAVCGAETLPCRRLVLACGHSARDTFRMLWEQGVAMEAKAFAVGFRVEHDQNWLDAAQYGAAHPPLPPASYKVTARAGDGRGVYSFCMCPGGYVVNASSEPGRLAVNGMSDSGRGSGRANSAVIVQVTPRDYGSPHPLAGIAFQRKLEEAAWRQGQGRIPMETLGDFRAAAEGKEPPRAAAVPGRVKGAAVSADLWPILPEELNRAFLEGMEQFDRMIPGFADAAAMLYGVESRTSSPVRIVRDQTMQSSLRGLYPCGEGAGYAGGITSAAMDGIRTAEAVAAALCGGSLPQG